MFIAVFNSIEKLKAKNVVDVFQTIRQLRLQRVAMVQTLVRSSYTISGLGICLIIIVRKEIFSFFKKNFFIAPIYILLSSVERLFRFI